MAADIEDPACSERKVKRTRVNGHAKLLVGQRVEVRSVEEGFQGSWHPGTVIACQDHARRVQYDHLLFEDGSENLIECVEVPPIVDGVRCANKMQCNYRGLIRPLPPRLHFGKRCLPYGQCVDVCYRDAWWEGVIFDHEDNSEHHNIFFPDIGDIMTFGIEMLRITQDWDEFTEDWKPRGNWIFLELIEEFQHEWPLQVSVRQIWYDVREKMDFMKLKEWTCSLRNIWKDLVLQVIYDNLKLTLKEFFLRLDSSEDLVEEYNKALELREPALKDALLNPQGDVGNSLAFVACQRPDLEAGLLPTNPDNANVPPFERDIEWGNLLPFMEGGEMDLNLFKSLKVPCLEESVYSISPGLSNLQINPDEFSGASSVYNSEKLFIAASKTPSRLELTSSVQRKGDRWLPADHDLVPEAEFCPDAIGEYYLFSKSNNKPSTALTKNLRKYLVYKGWKVEFTREQKSQRLRYSYISPAGKTYRSLRKLCQDLCEPAQEIFSLISQDGTGISSAAPYVPYPSPLIEPRVSKEAPIVSSPSSVVIAPEYCPQAVVDICSLVLDDKNDRRRWWGDAAIKELKFKAKKHLSAVGWSLWHIRRRTHWELQYRSPKGKCYYSLQKACKACINEGGLADWDASTCSPRPNINVNEDVGGHVAGESAALIGVECKGSLVSQNASREKWSMESSGISSSGELVAFGKIKVQGIRKMRKKRKHGELTSPSHLLGKNAQNAMSSMPKKGRKSRSLIKLRAEPNGNCQVRVLRSSKRARHVVVPHSSHHNPRTVLSWLIDNNVVLPRAKVYYSDRKDHRPMAEGRITRDGIKCSCCQNVFTLQKFEIHAGSSLDRPSSNIFLEDGRSLLECQLQLKRDNYMRSFTKKRRETKNKRHHSTNDYTCSVCHFGGELILCDQCPSSFHASCLGLKDIPDGDWFCPSCCCGICGQSRFSKDTEQFTDDSVLNCGQCEHQYHVGCLRKEGLVKLKSYPKGNWFCNKRCEQIFLGLRKLMGRPVPVGTDNLSWTLLRYGKCESDYDASDIETLMKNYSKLSVALSVMRECFEPVKESRTRRDLVEDIIFSRWSELNRLNFRGFYTVLLERNDELITVATVRVYGQKVAEIPLVGTRFQYRRLGMCRILMNELEKKLMELGVERLVLPAVPSLLHTWTTSFGFSKMTESERLNFLDYTFLDFQGTIMCQKLLNKVASTGARLLQGTQQRLREYINGSDNNDFDVNSAVSEVFQADHVEDSEIVHQGQVKLPTCLECIPCQS